MKTIGFIDIHPNNPLCEQYRASSSIDARDDDPSAIYLYRKTGDGYTYEKTLPYNDQDTPAGIEEFYVSIPAVMLDFRILNFPFSDREKIRRSTPLELDNFIMADPDEIVFDTVITGGAEETVDVLVAYMRKDALHQILTELARRNIDPRVITSIDLQAVIPALRETSSGSGFSESVAGLLSNPNDWDISRRVGAAQQEISTPVINLRSGQFAYRKDAEKTKRALRMTVFSGILLAVIIHAGFFSQTIMMKQEAASIAREMRTAYSDLFPGDRKVIDELYQLKSHLRGIKERSDALTGADPLRFLLNLSQRMEQNVVYTDIHLEKGIIKMKAEARSMDDLAKIKVKLSEFLSDVSISDIRPVDQGKVLFTVVARNQLS